MALSLALVAGGVTTLSALGPASPAAPPAATVSWVPAHPVQGAAVIITVSPDASPARATLVAVRATLTGLRLRFALGDGGTVPRGV